MSKLFAKKDLEYEVVASDLNILSKGEKLYKDGGFYSNQDESVIIKSDNYTGRIIKKIKNERQSN